MPIKAEVVDDPLSAVFSALSDPTRRAMLARLSQGEASVNELAAPFKMSLPAASKHVKVLQKAGLLTKTINAQQRPCRLNAIQLKQVVVWIDRFGIDIATINIAKEAINTSTKGINRSKKQIITLNTPLQQEKTHDQEPNDLQQQIGFDF